MRTIRSAVLPAPMAPPVGPPPHCAACGTTVGPFEPTSVRIGPDPTPVSRCVDPVACRMSADRAGTWKTYDPNA